MEEVLLTKFWLASSKVSCLHLLGFLEVLSNLFPSTHCFTDPDSSLMSDFIFREDNVVHDPPPLPLASKALIMSLYSWNYLVFIVLDISVYNHRYETGTETGLLRTCLEDKLTQSGHSVNGEHRSVILELFWQYQPLWDIISRCRVGV